MIPRKTAGAIAAGILALGALAACGGEPTEGGPGEPVHLRFLSLAWQTESLQVNQRLVEEWNAANPDIQVEYVQGDWGSVHDLLLTSFETGEAPDILHYEGAAIRDFARQGYLADLSGLLPDSLRTEITDEQWNLVTVDGAVTGVPFLLESHVVIANKTLLDEADIEVPGIDDPWTWDEFQGYAEELTDADTYGVAWSLKSPTNRVLNLALNFGGQFFYEEDGSTVVKVGPAEREVLQRIHDMLYIDGTAAPEAIGMGTADPLPGFFAGKYAMLPGAVWVRQQMVEQAPDGFEWVTLPPLMGDTQAQSANPQTLSIPADAPYQEEAMKFIEFFLNPENMAALAHGDWLVPTGKRAGEALIESTGGEQGWDVSVASVSALTAAAFQTVDGFAEWKSRHSEPALQQYFANQISLDELAALLENGGEQVLS